MKSPYVKLDVERYDELIEIEKSYDFKVAELVENSLVISGGFNPRIVINNPTKQQNIFYVELKKSAFDNNELRIKLRDADKQYILDFGIFLREKQNLKSLLLLSIMVLITSLALIIHLLLKL